MSGATENALKAMHKAMLKSAAGKTDLNILPENMHGEIQNYFAEITEDPISGAFSRKVSVHADSSGKPVDKEKQLETLAELRQRPRRGPAAAYVHLPYCESKCVYCGFFGGKYTPDKGASYLELLLSEIESEADLHKNSAPINALYLGGGTPTALQAPELEKLIATLRRSLPLSNDCEITVEGRLYKFGPDKIEACLSAGANRFSLGVQSFNTDIRRRLGRIETRENVIKHLERLASYNQAAIVIDLIYGLPGQSLADWENELKTFLDLPLDGVDLYQLNIFPGSALASAIESGSLPATAPLAEQGRFFELGVKTMQNARMRRLSMSHWGKTSRERNLYNPMAKNKSDCLNFGAGAGGLLHGYFMFNHNNVETYAELLGKGQKPIAMLSSPPEHMAPLNVILGQMEHCRLNLDELEAAMAAQKDAYYAGFKVRELYSPLLQNWLEAGLITLDGPWLELTMAGQFWQVNLTQALIGWLRRPGHP